MTQVECDLCFHLVKKYFGRIVANVGKFLCENKNQVLKQVIAGTKLKPSLVRKALCVLIKHKVVDFKKCKKHIEYNINLDSILLLLLIPRIIYTTKVLYGDTGELIVEEMLVHGMAEMDWIVNTVKSRLEETSERPDHAQVKKVFKDLVDSRFILLEQTIPSGDTKKEDSAKNENEVGGRKRRISDDDEDDTPDPKRMKVLETYSINFSRYKQYFRDEAIISGIKQKFGNICSEIIRTILRISEVTTSAHAERTQPISANEIRHELPSSIILPINHIEQYLSIMIADERKLVQTLDESSSNMYVVNLKKCVEALCEANVLSYIQERYGSKCCRIFRLLMLKKHMEQKQVEDFAMIPSKEAKELLYQMWSEHILVMQELPKTVDHAPSRTYYLFNVNTPKVIRTILSRTHRTLVNLLARQQHEKKSNKRLTEKQHRVELIKANIQEGDDAQLEEIEEMLTPAERDNLQKFEHCCNKLGKTQIQVSNTAFLLNFYLSQ